MAVAVRGYTTANNGSTATLTTIATAYTGWTTANPVVGDLLVAVIFINATAETITQTGTGAWTIPASNSNASTVGFTSALAYRQYTAGDAAPTWNWTGAAPYAYFMFALHSTGPGSVVFDAEGTVNVVTTAASAITPNTASAINRSDAALVINAAQYQTSGSHAISMTTPCVGFSVVGAMGGYAGAASQHANDVSAFLKTGPVPPGTVTPGAQTFNEVVACNAYTLLVTDTSQPAALQPQRKNTGEVKFRRREKPWLLPAVPKEQSPPLELSGFGTFAAIGATDTIDHVTVTVNQFQSNTLMAGPRIELWDFSGTPTLLNSMTGSATISSANTDSFSTYGIAYSQLATLRVRIYGEQGGAPSGAVQNVNWTSLNVTFTPFAGLSVLARVATGTSAAASQPVVVAVAVNAVKATGTGTAQNATGPANNTNATATVATGTGAAQSPVAAVGVNAVLAAAEPGGGQPNPAVAIGVNAVLAAAEPGGGQPNPAVAISVNAVLAAAEPGGGQPNPATAIGVNAAVATGTGAAQGATAQTTSSGTATAVLATATGAALSSAFPLIGLATGTGTAQNATATSAASVTAVLATGTGAALSTAFPDVSQAVGTGAALNPVATSVSIATTVLATGTGAALSTAFPLIGNATGTGAALNPAAISVSIVATVLATGTGAAQNANPPTPAGLATGTGAAQNATAQTVSSGTANATLATAAGAALSTAFPDATQATGTGAAQSPAAAVGVTAVVATGTGAALSTAFPDITVATGTSAAQNAAAAISVIATVATGTGAALSSAFPLIGVATGTGAAQNVTAQTTSSGTANAVLATAAGAALSSAFPDLTVATGVGTALNPAATSVSTVTAVLATGTGTAQSPAPAIGVSVTVATGVGTAINPAVIGGIVTSPALEGYGFGTFAQIPAGAVIISVVAAITVTGSNVGIGAPTYQLWDGASAQIGQDQTGVASTDPAHIDTVTFTGVTYAQLPTLRLRMFADSVAGNAGATASADTIALSVVWAPAVSVTITPTVFITTVAFPGPTVSAITNVAVTPATLAINPAFPQSTAGLYTATAAPATYTVPVTFQGVLVSAISNAAAAPGALSVTMTFPQSTAGLYNATALLSTLTVAVTLPASAVSAITNATATPAALTAGTGFPGATAGLLNATASLSFLAVSLAFSPPGVSAVTNAAINAAILVINMTFPTPTESTNQTSPGWPTANDIPVAGSGTWTNPGNIIGPPDGSDAVWTST